MKRNAVLRSFLLFPVLCLLLLGSAAAAAPESEQQWEENGVHFLQQVFLTEPDKSLEQLVQEELCRGDITYRCSDLTWEPVLGEEEVPWQETVHVTTRTDHLAEILAALEEAMEVEHEGAVGTLHLDKESLHTAASAVQSETVPVYARQTFAGLAANDPSLISPSLEQDGAALSLTGITWTVEQADVVDGVEVPLTWKADASYSGSVRRSLPAEYETTAVYSGTLTRTVQTGLRVTVTYKEVPKVVALTASEEPVPTASPVTDEKPDSVSDFVKYAVCAGLAAVALELLVFLGRRGYRAAVKRKLSGRRQNSVSLKGDKKV